MKKLSLLLICLFTLTMTPAKGQAPTERRTHTMFVFPNFRKAGIVFFFGRKGHAVANIGYKNAGLYYLKDDTTNTIMRADLGTVLRVVFDTVTYVKVDSTMGKLIAEKNGRSLALVTKIDEGFLHSDEAKGMALPYFEMDVPGMSQVWELNADRIDGIGLPLKEKFYFIVDGKAIPATEGAVKRHVKPEKKADFKKLMTDRWWTWRDPNDLSKLLDYM